MEIEIMYKGSPVYCVIDNEMYEELSKYKWYLDSNGYPSMTKWSDGKTKSIRLHIYIMGKKEGYYVDHINKNKLDNRKENLRHVTPTQNARNNSYLGISYRKSVNKWRAYVAIKRKQIHIGYFNSKEEALEAKKKGG